MIFRGSTRIFNCKQRIAVKPGQSHSQYLYMLVAHSTRSFPECILMCGLAVILVSTKDIRRR